MIENTLALAGIGLFMLIVWYSVKLFIHMRVQVKLVRSACDSLSRIEPEHPLIAEANSAIAEAKMYRIGVGIARLESVRRQINLAINPIVGMDNIKPKQSGSLVHTLIDQMHKRTMERSE